MFGDNSYGKLGTGNSQPNTHMQPYQIDTFSHSVMQISCGHNHTSFVLKNGEVYMCGKGAFGQLGYGGSNDQSFPVPVCFFKDNNISIKQSSCGCDFSAFVSENGELFMCGIGELGQLGNGKLLNQLFPIKVNLNGVLEVCCGKFHTLALNKSGELYSFGGNQFGQLGISTKQPSSFPKKIAFEKKVKKIACSVCSCCINEDGDLFLWGCLNGMIQLAPSRVTPIINCIDVSVGNNFICAIDIKQDVWAWGSNSFGELGFSDFVSRKMPEKLVCLQKAVITQISCGRGHVLAIGKNDISKKVVHHSRHNSAIERSNKISLNDESSIHAIRKLECEILCLKASLANKNEENVKLTLASNEIAAKLNDANKAIQTLNKKLKEEEEKHFVEKNDLQNKVESLQMQLLVGNDGKYIKSKEEQNSRIINIDDVLMWSSRKKMQTPKHNSIFSEKTKKIVKNIATLTANKENIKSSAKAMPKPHLYRACSSVIGNAQMYSK